MPTGKDDVVNLIDSDDEDIRSAIKVPVPQDPFFASATSSKKRQVERIEISDDGSSAGSKINTHKRIATKETSDSNSSATPSPYMTRITNGTAPPQYPPMPYMNGLGMMPPPGGYMPMSGFPSPFGFMASQYMSTFLPGTLPRDNTYNSTDRVSTTGSYTPRTIERTLPPKPQSGTQVDFLVAPPEEDNPLTIDDCILELVEIDKYDDDQVLIECASIKGKVNNASGEHFGIADVGDEVELIRETDHPTDHNAMIVQNLLEISLGYLASGITQVISPLIDHSRIQVNATVSSPTTENHTMLNMTILTPSSNEQLLRRLLRQHKLIPPPEPVAIKQLPTDGTNGFVSASALSRTPSWQSNSHMLPKNGQVQAEEHWKMLLQFGSELDQKSSQAILDNVGMKEAELAALEEAPQPDGLVTQLLPYQRQGLGWMLAAEHPAQPTTSRESQFWVIKQLVDGSTVYFNTATNSIAQGVPRLYRGGILADDMGLGKTIQIISLLLSDLDGQPFVKTPMSVSNQYCNTTLIVCPVSVVGNWLTQIETHTQVGRIKYHVFHGDKRIRDHRYLQSMDLVITTYAVMSLNVDCTPLHRVRWRRVVLDEGHNIRAKNTKQARAACNLVAERKWVLSGTPLQNKLDDLYSLLKFIEYFPFDQYDIWKTTFDRPIKQGRPSAIDLFKQMMKDLCLRRTKVMKFNGKPLLELPSISYLVHKIEFRPEERAVYAKWEARSRRALAEIIALSEKKLAGIATTDGATGAGAGGIGNMLKYLTRLRQLCNHRILAEKELEQQKHAGGIEQLQALLRENLADDCPLCLHQIRTPCITTCKHWFCLECIQPIVESDRSCPICLHRLDGKNSLIELPGQDDLEDSQSGEKVSTIADLINKFDCPTADFQSSSKIDALMTFLETCRSRDSSIKSVVFSQWTSMLDLLEVPLRAQGFAFVRLDGSMPRKTRDANIDRFSSDPRVLIFLVSLTCGSTGLNLIAASNCFLMDPWWNPQIERQAIDRIYRIGQKKPVTVIRFAMLNSVEERVLLLQETKRHLAAVAFGEESNMKDVDSKSNRLEDIRALLGNAANGAEDDPGSESFDEEF